MKKFLKNNWMILIAFFSLLIILCFNVRKYIINDQHLSKSDFEIRESCKNSDIKDKEKKEFCELVEKTPVYKSDFYSMLFSVSSNGYSIISYYILFLIIIVPPIYNICNYLKNKGFPKMKKKKVFSKLFFESSKSIFILPVLAIIAFIICFVYTGNFDYKNAVDGSLVVWSASTMKNPIIFMLSHLIRMLLVSILYVNISLCVCKKNHNFFIATIISFLSFILLECILEIISKVIFSNDLGIVFNILGPLSLFDSFGVIHLFFIPLISAIVSFAILYRVYFIKNKVVA